MVPITIAYTFGEEHEKITLSRGQIMERLGPNATAEDAQQFTRIWHTRFYDIGNPDFDAQDDLDDTWAEIVALMADDFTASATI